MKETTGLMLSGDLKKIIRNNNRFREAVTTKPYQNRLGFSSHHPGRPVHENPKLHGLLSQGFWLDLALKIWDNFPKY
jgi:hypothetical protein